MSWTSDDHHIRAGARRIGDTAASSVATAARLLRCHRQAQLNRSTADSQGTVTNTDARGKVISHEFTSGNVTTIYDERGRNVGRVRTSPPR